MLSIADRPLLTAADVPKGTAETDSDQLYAPPRAPPEEWALYIRQHMNDKVYETLVANKVPWLIIKQLVDEDWVDVSTLLARWANTEALYTVGAASLEIGDWPPKHVEKVLARMASSMEDLRRYKTLRLEQAQKSKNSLVVDELDRRSMEKAFQEATGEKAPLDRQGSANMLGKLDRSAAEGRVEVLDGKELVPYHPAPWIRTTTIHTRNPDGTFTEQEVKTRPTPMTAEQWIDAMRLWYTTLMMALCAHAEHANLKVKWEDLRDFYEQFLFGSTILRRRNAPPLAQVMVAERKAWQAIATLMWSNGCTLGEALKEVKGDHLWWTNELDMVRNSATPPAAPGKGKGKGKHDRAPPPTRVRDTRGTTRHVQQNQIQQRQQKGKGRGKQSGRGGGAPRNDLQQRALPQAGRKGAGRSQGPQPRIPTAQWPEPPNGVEFCRDFHIRSQCTQGRGCHREHTCPGCGQGPHSLALCRNI